MVGKKQGSKAALREEGLAKTDNDMKLTSWPVVIPINQKNYYTDYLKREDQYLAFRQDAHESNENNAGTPAEAADMDEEMADAETGDVRGSKTVILHPGSQNLRIGLGSDALPKTVPMVIARKAKESESEEKGAGLRPRRKPADEAPPQREKWFGPEFASDFTSMATELKQHMRNIKLRLLPNCKELVINYNRKVTPESISEHNDPLRIDWTEIDPKSAPDYITGHAALRIPEDSNPRYKLFWPIRHGWFNERDYSSANMILEDYEQILGSALRSQLGLTSRKEISQYDCVFVIPDLYEKAYGITSLGILLRCFGFKRVCFIQESVATTFGAGFMSGCIVDIGAQKTSIACVDDGMIAENSRINMKYGGMDITEAFIKMMLYDYFPYADINLLRRYDFLLAEELKQQHCTMKESDVSVIALEFHLRVSGQDTYKYGFKTYDETMLAPMGFFRPSIFDHSHKLQGRRTLMDRSYDLYDSSPNDPVSSAQIAVLQSSNVTAGTNGTTASPNIKRGPLTVASRLVEAENTPRSSVAGSPAPEGTPQPTGATDGPALTKDPLEEKMAAAEERDKLLPVMPLDQAIVTSVTHAFIDERKVREFIGSITIVGGGAKLSNLNVFLEERLKRRYPQYANHVLIGGAPRELDSQVVVWKGGSIFGKLSTNDSWINWPEFDYHANRILTQKCQFVW